MSKHTLGPWKASEGYPSDIWHVDMPSRGYSVVVSRAEDDWDMAIDEVQANAQLIAAAPELLAALEAMLDPTHRCGEDCVMSEPCPIGEQARAAIAKAKGGA